MIDIETASTEYNAVILSIGAVCFSLQNPGLPPVTFEVSIDKEDGESLGLHVSQDTLDWWKKQPQEVYNHIFLNTEKVSTKEGLTQLHSFLARYPTIKQYWCQGINFDPVVLETAYKACGMLPKWKFYQLRDSRTVQYLIPRIPFSKPKDAHTPVADCLYQIKMVRYVYQQLNIVPSNPIEKKEENKSHPDWICIGENCGTRNYHFRNECYKCFKDKNGNQQPIVKEWKCESCEGNNFGYRTKCFKCKCRRKTDFYTDNTTINN